MREVEPSRYAVSTRHEGYRDAIVRDVDVQEDRETGPIELLLEPLLSVTVTVVDPAERPVAGAEVAVVEYPEDRWRERSGDWVTVSGVDGVATFDGIRSARIGVHAVATGFRVSGQLVELNGDADRVVVVLVAGGEMRGRIIAADTGQPFPSGHRPGSLMAFRSIVEPRGGAVGTGLPVVEDGSFVEGGLAPGPYELTISAEGYRDLKLGPRELPPGGVLDWGTIELQRISGPAVDVLVVDRTGQPVDEVQISTAYGSRMPELTDSDGRASLTGLAAGQHRILARHPDYARGRSEPFTVTEGSGRIAVTVRLGRGGTVVGTAFAEDGSVLAATEVDLDAVEENAVRRATTDTEVVFRFTTVPAGTYRLRFPHPPTAYTASEDFMVLDDETVRRDAHHPPRRRVTGLVLDTGGQPVPGCRIEYGRPVAAEDGSWKIDTYYRSSSGSTATDDEGHFVIFEIRPQAVSVTTPDGRRAMFGVPSGLTEFTLRMPDPEGGATGTVRGVTRDARSGRPLGHVAVSVQSTGDDQGPRRLLRFGQSSNSDGTFALWVPAGPYRLETRRDGFADEWRAIALSPGQTLGLDLQLYEAGHLAFLVDSPEPDPRARLTVEAQLAGDPKTRIATTASVGRSFSLMRLRRGELYDVTISAAGYRSYRGSHRVTGGDGEPIRVVLVR